VTPRESITRILAPAVGEERASELVDERARAVLGTSRVITDKDADALLRSFATDQSLVGTAARLALRRQQARDPSPASGDAVTLASIASMLESALGTDKARSVVAETAARLGVFGETCTRAQAARVFEELAAMEGLVGVSARFAKVRFLLRTA
jgi:hypothetical protein